MTYTVQQGDSLFAIAKRFNTTVENLRTLNNLSSTNLSIGQVLKITHTTTPTTQPTNTQTSNIAPKTTTNTVRYVVQAGDTLGAIARRFGVTVDALQKNNKLTNDRINIGQVLRILIESSKPQNTNPTPTPKKEEDKQEITPTPTPTPTVLVTNPVNLSPAVTATASIQAMAEARRIFQMQVESGEELLANNLKGMVGRHQVNNIEDLQAVQIRLVQLGVLASNHTESPQHIFEKMGRTPITSNLIPQTIAAIERLQREQISYWTENPTRSALIGASNFTPGVVSNGDATFRFLKDAARYTITFPHPNDNSPVKVQFRNFVRSSFTVSTAGVSFAGNSKPEIPIDVMLRLGLDSRSAQALLYVSKNEGNFDAINSFDRAIFSWGFIQFAGGNRGLAPLMMLIKQKAPKAFESFFQRFGVDVEINPSTKNIDFVVTNPFAKDGRFIVKGLEAEQLLRQDKVLTAVFIRAGYYLPIITLQLEAAINDYVRPALNSRLNILIGSTQMNNLLITDYIKSIAGITLVLDLAVNKGITGARNILTQAIQLVATQQALTTPELLKNLNEKRLLEQVLATGQGNNDANIIKRVTALLQSGLSTDKNSA